MGCMIIFSLQAIADLESAVRFIAKDNPDAAVRVGNSLMDRVAILDPARRLPSVPRAQTGFATPHLYRPG